MSEEKILTYKGHPLMRKDNLIYYGSMADSHIVMLQVLETKKQADMEIATRVSVQLQLTDPAAKSLVCMQLWMLVAFGWNVPLPANKFKSFNPQQVSAADFYIATYLGHTTKKE